MNEIFVQPYTTLESLTDLCWRLFECAGIDGDKNEYYEYYSSLPYLAYQNRLMLKKLPADTEKALKVLDEAVMIAKDTGSPKFISYCDDIDFPIASYLKSKGMEEFFCQAGMTYFTGNKVSGCKQDVIEIGHDRLEEWCYVCDEAFGKKDEISIYETLLADEKCKFFACESEGNIVSTGMYCIDDNNTNMGIHSIGTLADHRGNSYASAIVVRIIMEAEKLKIPMLTLQASPLGEPVYAQLGFKKLTMIHSFA